MWSSGRCAQAEELLSQVVELREKVSRLRSIRESEREIDWWKHTLPSLRLTHEPANTQETKVLPSHQAVGENLAQAGEWMQVSAQGGKRALSLPTSPSRLPLYNRYQSLEHDSQNDDIELQPCRIVAKQ